MTRDRDNASVAAVRAAAGAFNRGDVDAYLDAFDPDGVRWVVGLDEPLTLRHVRDTTEQMLAAFENLELAGEALFGGAGRVCAQWRLTGTHVGDLWGIPASGRSIGVRTCEVYELTDGRVRQVWTYGDPHELLRQIEPTREVQRS